MPIHIQVAKCIQTLANFSDLTGCKESYMVFMNTFIENKFATMHSFLEEISTESEKDILNLNTDSSPRSAEIDNQNYLYWENLGNSLSEDSIDISLCLAKLHRQLEDYLKMIPAQVRLPICPHHVHHHREGPSLHMFRE